MKHIATNMKSITIQTTVGVGVERAWEVYTDPGHIKKWAFASDDWEVGDVKNDLRVGGKFLTNMRAKDQSAGFDFTGEYTEIAPNEKIAYTMTDGRKAEVWFKEMGEVTKVTVIFEMENENPEEMQRAGWQAILDNYKKEAEKLM